MKIIFYIYDMEVRNIYPTFKENVYHVDTDKGYLHFILDRQKGIKKIYWGDLSKFCRSEVKEPYRKAIKFKIEQQMAYQGIFHKKFKSENETYGISFGMLMYSLSSENKIEEYVVDRIYQKYCLLSGEGGRYKVDMESLIWFGQTANQIKRFYKDKKILEERLQNQK